MAFDVSGLSEYVKVNDRKIGLKVVAGATTFDYLISKGQVIFSAKTKEQSGFMNQDPVFQDGNSCGWNPLGSTSLTAKTLEAKPIKVQSQFCAKDLYNTIFNVGISKGQYPDKEIHDEIWKTVIDNQTEIVNSRVEQLMWQGDTSATASTPNYQYLNKADGYLKKITQAGTSSIQLVGVTGSNVVEQLLSVYNAIPVEIAMHKDFVMFIGKDAHRLYRTQLSFLPNKVDNDTKGFEKLFATDATLIPTEGLNYKKYVVFGLITDFAAITDDGTTDVNGAEFKYDEGSQLYRLEFRFSIGVDALQVSQVGMYKLSF